MSTVNSDVYSVGKAEKINIEKSIDEIRKGNGYYVSNTIDTGAGIITYVMLKPLKSTVAYHITFKVAAETATQMWIYEGTGATNTGAHQALTLTPWSMNRNSATGSILILQGIMTGASGTGSRIYSGYCPSWADIRFGSSDSRQNELILNSNYIYLVGISGSAGRIGFETYWYEQ